MPRKRAPLQKKPAHSNRATRVTPRTAQLNAARATKAASSWDGVVGVGGRVVVVVVVVSGSGGVVVQTGIVQGDGAVVAQPGFSRGKRGIL